MMGLDRMIDEIGRHMVTSAAPQPPRANLTALTGERDDRFGRLPTAPTRLIGRDDEVARIVALLRGREDPDGPPGASSRLVTLTGPGGVGKTRLALAVAADLGGDVASSRFVGLAAIADPRLVVAAIARALGVEESGERPVLARVKDALRNRATLLLIDNFEQVVEAAPLLAELLADAPHLRLLVTSRSALRLSGERVLAVAPLAVPDAGRGPATDPAGAAAVQLFVDRAQAVRPEFVLGPENVEVVAAICRRLDGLPLAIELAAAWLRVLSPPALLARLGQRLPLLTGGPRDLPARQQTIRDAVAWSDHLLESDERRLFHRLAVFAGGFGLDAAAAVTDADSLGIDILDGIAGLVERSLLTTPGADQGAGEPRFGMLEIVREYGLEQLAAAGDATATRDRQAVWCVELAERARDANDTPEEGRWRDRLESEHDNVRGALTWLLGQGDAASSLRLAGAVGSFWFVRGHLSEGRHWLAAALALPGDPPFSYWAEAVAAAGTLAYHQGDYAQAIALAEQLVTAARGRDHAPSVLRGLFLVGLVAYDQGELKRAEAALAEALARARAADDAKWVALVLSVLGPVVRELGQTERAGELLTEADRRWRERGSVWGVAVTALGLAMVALARGEPRRAAALGASSLRVRWEERDPWGITQCLVVAATIARLAARPAESVRLLGAISALRESAGIALSYGLRRMAEADLAVTKAALPASAFADAWRAGAALPLAMVVAEALAILDAPEALTPAPASAEAAIALTARELDVLRLAADGLPDREIGERLSISHRTVMKHMTNILAKLDLDSRTAAAAYAVRRGLV